MASALALRAPKRYAGIAMMHGPLPFETDVPLERDRLSQAEVFYGYGSADAVIPAALMQRSIAWLRDESGANASSTNIRGARDPARRSARPPRWYESLT